MRVVHNFLNLFSLLRATEILRYGILLSDPAQEKRKLLQTWVAEGENRTNCESRVVVQKESANIYRGQKELVSVRDMLLVKQWPLEKVRGIIARGGGVPDADAPNCAALMQFWCTVSRTQTEEESVRQTASTEIAAQTTAEGVGALMSLSTVPRGHAALTVSQAQLDEITRSTQPPVASGGKGKGWVENLKFHHATPCSVVPMVLGYPSQWEGSYVKKSNLIFGAGC